ncbi:hypothetical protein [Roseomonas indoligenes]|uniref:Uncharacterized protein n=1 Tax=Roseomonas indoligenes TaxID=2820811 RepID=A0A940S840_9PROT|nr:hypothetical protein [Pararoseomonas indoligenes]MBP0495550.1 hypothetical protein [Pararoseomonas indoligenes]
MAELSVDARQLGKLLDGRHKQVILSRSLELGDQLLLPLDAQLARARAEELSRIGLALVSSQTSGTSCVALLG